MLEKSSKLDKSLMDAYRSIHEIHQGHAAGDSDTDKQASQLASDIRYKAKGRIKGDASPETKKKIYLSLLAASSASSIVKTKAKKKLLGESVEAVAKKTVKGGINLAKKGVKKYQDFNKRWKGKNLQDKVASAVLTKARNVAADAVDRVDKWSSSRPSTSTSSKKETPKSSSSGQSLGQQARNNPEKKKEMIKARGGKTEGFSNWRSDFSLTEDAAYHKVLKDLKGQFGSNAVLGTGEKIKDTRSEKSKKKETRKRATSDELERRFRVRNPKKTSGRYPKDDEEGDKRARKREKEQGVRPESLPGVNETAPTVAKIINAVREDAQYGYDSRGRSKNPADIKKRKKVSEGKLIHGPFGPYITGQKMPKEHKETPLKQVPYEGLNGNRKAVGEAKVDQGLDDEAKEDARNYRRFGTRHNQHGTAVLRRSLERSKRGEKKVKGAKSVEEEVGLSSSAKMKEAQKEAARQRKEQQAVEKEKKALKKEETAPAVAKIIEKIQINKVSPKSPNCIIMPKKEEISDNGKKSTKEVVTKKQKKFFNQEGKTYKDFLKEYVQALTKAASKQAAKGAITTTAKTVGKETGGAIVKSGGSAIKKTGTSSITKPSTSAIVKKPTGSLTTTKGGPSPKPKGGPLETRKGGPWTKKGDPLAKTDKGELAKQEKKKERKDINMNLPSGPSKMDHHTATTVNPQ